MKRLYILVALSALLTLNSAHANVSSYSNPIDIANSIRSVAGLSVGFEKALQPLFDVNYDLNALLPADYNQDATIGTVIEYLFNLVPNLDSLAVLSDNIRIFIEEFTPAERTALQTLFERSEIPANFVPDINILGDRELVQTLRDKNDYAPDVTTIQEQLDLIKPFAIADGRTDLVNRAQANLQLLVKE